MKNPIKAISTANQQLRIFGILSLSTAFCLALVAVRIYYMNFNYDKFNSPLDLVTSRGSTFLFLVWNLFLAWIPYWVAISIEGFYKISQSKIFAAGLMLFWLLFFPNAPYIITDLLHLHNRYPIPIWYDVILFVSFAWTGLLLGLISLHEVRLFVAKVYSEKVSWFFTISATVLCGFGIYLGRCLRWNSWDVLTNPWQLLKDILGSLTESMAINITIIFSIFLMVGYLTLNTLISKSR